MSTAPSHRMLRLAATAVAALLAIPAAADDTELFVSQQGLIANSARTNVLFIIDTSGSMDTLVETQTPFDPARQFTGCYRSDVVYFNTTATLPDCASQNFFAKTLNKCQASLSSLATAGQYGGFLLGYSVQRQRWEALASQSPVECQADRGVAGDGVDTSKPYAANGPGGPWAADSSQEPAWNSQFQIFDGNWLNWKTNPPTTTRTRLQIVQDVVNTLVGNLRDVNVGVMRFNLDNGGAVIQALGNVDTTRAAIESTVTGLTAAGQTPLAETLYEAGLYFGGANVDFGNLAPVFSVAGSRSGNNSASPTYNSPVTAACQKNFIILLTDGEPNFDTDADARIAAQPDFAATLGRTACDGSGDGACLDDMAEYLFKHDVNANLPGIQNVVVNTIGFTIDVPLLAETARRGGGQYFLADDTASLTAVLTELVRGVIERAGTFTAPLVPANIFNRTQSLSDVFVSVFQPTGTAHWPGNLKKYRFVNGLLVGQNGLPAIDPATGFFSADAFSYWSAAADGDRVKEGGAANEIPAPASRNLYTNIVPGNLNQNTNLVAVSNGQLTAALLGVASTDRDTLITWARGQDVNDDNTDGSTADPRHAMGDPLHVRPVSVTYGGTVQNPDAVIFTATNDGYLHAVSPDDGHELWAFIPKRLLPRLHELFLDGLTPVHRYGLDGEIRVYIRNDDGIPGISGAERVILLFGMGRGGDSVFALDVTNRNSPALLWEINSSTTGFESLGQTWSTPVVAKVNTGNDVLVAIFGGGYDDGQDNRGYRTDQIGNAVFMVDLLSGAKVWSAGPDQNHDLTLPAMQNSIPATLRVADLNGDGFTDRMYVGDTGGRLWRFDIVNGRSAASLVEGGVLATLGAADLGTPSAADVRRFYETPDVVRGSSAKRDFLAINLGSGYRGHPLDTDVEDAFFSVRDYAFAQVIPTVPYPAPVTFNQLVDITNLPGAVLPVDSKGWLLRMVQGTGEKILSDAITFAGSVFFSSYTPTGSGDACVAGGGINRAYVVSVFDANPLLNLDGVGDDTNLTATDRFRVLRQTSIAPEPTFLFSPDAQNGPTVCIGMECFAVNPNGTPGKKIWRWYWRQDQGP